MINSLDNPWGDSGKKNSSSEKTTGNSNSSIFDGVKRVINEKRVELLRTLSVDTKGNKSSEPLQRNKNPEPALRIATLALCLIALMLWLSTGFFTINPDEEGVVLRFGKYNRTVFAGLNYKLPSPLEEVEKVKTTTINRVLIGSAIDGFEKGSANQEIGESSLLTANNNGPNVMKDKPLASATSGERFSVNNAVIADESSNPDMMLTGDENIIDLQFYVQWYVGNARDYLFNIANVAETVRLTAESVMREIIGRSKLYEALSEQRQAIELDAKKTLQRVLDSYNAGVVIDNLGILHSYVAPEVRDAYRDIQSAKADNVRLINQAYAYRNDIIPRTRGEAYAILERAKAYKEAEIAKARGESSRFNSILKEYLVAQEVTRKRMYMDTMMHIMPNIKKVIFDKNATNTLQLLPTGDMWKGVEGEGLGKKADSK